jgi:hypothetical protein
MQAMKTTPCERARRQILQSAGNQRFSVQNRQGAQNGVIPSRHTGRGRVPAGAGRPAIIAVLRKNFSIQRKIY